MGPLSKTIVAQMEKLGRDATSLARELDEATGVEGASPGAAEMQAKVEAMITGEPEAISFFFDDAWRLEALSRVLGLDIETLQARREAQRSFRVLVLDRRLDLASRRYLKRRQSSNEDRFAVIEPDEPTPEALLELARRTPGALVVLSDETDPAPFETAGLETTRVRWQRRGYVLTVDESLVPLPPAPPPKMIDDDGMPMLPHDEYEQRILSSRKASAEKERVQAIIDQGGIPTFRASEIVLFLGRKADAEAVTWVPDPSSEPLFEAWMDHEAPLRIWCHEGKLFFVGTESREVLEVLRAHHPVEQPASFPRALERLDRLNPFLCLNDEGEWRFTGRWEEVRQEVADECGVDISSTFASWPERILERAKPRSHVFVQRAPALEARARAALESLVARPMSIAIDGADLVFLLRKMVDAPLVVIPPEPLDQFHVVADLGNGRLLWARAFHFPDEEPRVLHRIDSQDCPWKGEGETFCLDGGDVRVWLVLMSSAVLSPPPTGNLG